MGESGGETGLSVSEGVLLGHALVARVAEDLGVRVFFIKGPASVQLGLRRPKISNDVDVFVAPDDLDLLLDGLRERGWRERPVDPDSRAFPKHSVTVDHPDWPCCVDVHYRFPGMEKDAGECFELIWVHTQALSLTGQQVRVPTKALGIVILALHALRTPHLEPSRLELDVLSSVVQQEQLQSEVLDLATRTGALAAMRPFLEAVVLGEEAPVWPGPSTEWRNRILAREPGSARLLALAQAPWPAKPGMLWRSVAPKSETFLGGDIYADVSFSGRLGLHGARWSRFLKALPQIIRDFSHYRA